MNFFQRLRDALGVNEEYEDYYYYDDSELADAAVPPDALLDRRPAPNALPNLPNNVIGLPGLPGQTEVVVMEPRSFDEMTRVVTALRERKSVILNLTYISDDQAQRSADYVAGATFAIDGHQTRLGERIFLFTPNYVHISSYPDLPVEPPAPVAPLPASQSSPMPPQLNQPMPPRPAQYHPTANPGL